jgi:hypothetical protein
VPLPRPLYQLGQQRLQQSVGLVVVAGLRTVSLERTPEVRAAYAESTSRIIAAGQLAAARFASVFVGSFVELEETPDLGRALAGHLTGPDDPHAIVGLLRLWSLMDDGSEELEARGLAGIFASNLAEGDLQAAQRDGLDEATRASHRSARWGLEPNAEACEWCAEIAALGSVFPDAETVPFHSHGPCRCAPVPDFGGEE